MGLDPMRVVKEGAVNLLFVAEDVDSRGQGEGIMRR